MTCPCPYCERRGKHELPNARPEMPSVDDIREAAAADWEDHVFDIERSHWIYIFSSGVRWLQSRLKGEGLR